MRDGPHLGFGNNGTAGAPHLFKYGIEGADQEANRAKKSVLARYRPIFDRYPVVSPYLPPPTFCWWGWSGGERARRPSLILLPFYS